MVAKKAFFVGMVTFFAAVTSTGCVSSDEGGPCKEGVTEPCTCTGNTLGTKMCTNGVPYCQCGPVGTGGVSQAVSVAGSSATGAGGKAAVQKTTNAAGKANTKTGVGGAKTGAAGTSGKGTAGRATTGAGGKVSTSGNGPRIPDITETCPDFTARTSSFMGVSGVSITAGPKAAGPTAPILFYWHGTGSTSGEYAMMDGPISNGVTAEGGVIVSFQGLSGSGDAMCSGTMIFDTGSFLLTDQIYACAVKNHNVDPSRVYVAGCSAGGLFSACMAANRSSYVAAAVPNSGGFVMPMAFEDDHTPALMTRHGAPGVDVVIIDFSNSSKTADDAFKNRGGFVVNCNHGGMHCGGSVLSAQGWEFMKAHPFGVSPEPWAGGLPSGWPASCAIY